MRCLYCGKQLALLKRLTGGGEFCSVAHKHSYQEEYNRLALSRLLQAQSKPGEIKVFATRAPAPTEGLGQPLPPGASRRRALPASSPIPEPVAETPRAPVRSERVFYAPVAVEETVQEAVEETVPVAMAETFEEPVEQTPPLEAAEEAPPVVTVFAMEIPAYTSLADGIPYVEPWLDIVGDPTRPVWQASDRSANLLLGTLVAHGGPPKGEVEIRARAVDAAPLEFAPENVNLSALSGRTIASEVTSRILAEAESEQLFSSLPAGELAPLEICSSVAGTLPTAMDLAAEPAEFTKEKANLHVPFAFTATPARAFPAASPIELDIRVTASGAGLQTSSNGALRFPVRITFQDSSLLNLYPAGIDFPAEDSEVILVAPWADELLTPSNGFNSGDESALTGEEGSGSPREVLEALSKLHQDLAAQQEEVVEPPAEPRATDLELVTEPVGQNTIAAGPAEPTATTIDISAEPADEQPIPGSAHDLFEIPLKTFAPAKPALAVESNALVSHWPEMPRLKALPLRPKVAQAPPGFSPQSGAVQAKPASTEPKSKEPAPQPRPEVRTTQIPAPAAKQPAPPVKSPPTVQSVKPGQPSKHGQPVTPVQAGKPAQTVKPTQPPVKTATAAGAGAQTPPKQSTSQTPQAAAPAQPAAHETKGSAQPLPVPSAPEPATKPSEEAMPTFASIQSGKNGSFIGSLKGKLILAILLVVTAGGVFYSVSNKPHPPARPTAATTEDGVGPSIMLGEGGWVQNWGGDTNGSHAGRQITIYRPSLKLSDYRIEFQGEIDSKSIGWVFRAMDPYNYYAMKLAIVTPGLSPKIALIKYAVVQGHETELGRVALDMAARNDTLFNVRMDVRGSKFSTSVQGQPVDVWTDEQLKSGGVGFLNERAERARIKSAAISYLTGGKN